MSRAPFLGQRRKFVLAFDVGTTFSGISYSILDPGQVPEIKGVTRFPADEQSSGSSKIPTVIYYDRNGNVRAVGAEAMQECIYDTVQDEGWIKAEWFKLHLRPMTEASKLVSDGLPPLPLNKSIVDVLADFLKYLLHCASSYIKDTHANGEDLWSSVEKEINFVLTHPNGWEGFQQSQMRRAAILAGLIPDSKEGHARVLFVTEGEASLHFAIQNGLTVEDMKEGDGVVIVDAGGGTIDVSAYSRDEALGKDIFKEIAIPECHFHGSIFVSIHARAFLNNYLAESPFIDDLDHIVRCFDATTKLRFRHHNEPEYIKFGSTRDNDDGHRIRFGQMKLDGSDICEFFRPSVKCITEAVMEQRKSAHGRVTHVVLVGGFAANDWLRNEVHKVLKPLCLDVVRPESRVNKAVSDGAVFFYLNNFVRSRVTKVAYGGNTRPFYSPCNPEHQKRSASVIALPSGRIVVPHHFSIILPSGTRVSEKKEFRVRLSNESELKMSNIALLISCYRGRLALPQWTDVEADMYEDVCKVTADMSQVKQTPQSRVDGKTYYRMCFDVVLLFGLTELQAQLAWVEDGVVKRGPTTIIYAPQSTKE